MLRSPRLRRRLARTALGLGLAGALVAAGLTWTNTADVPEGGSRGTAPPGGTETPSQRPIVRLSDEDERAALAVAREFVLTAVVRERLADAWELAHADLRGGLTRAQWLRGEIPVVPYPVDGANWRIGYSYADELGLEVSVEPTTGETVRSMVFDMQLRAVGAGEGRRWLVAAWSPRGGTIFAEPPRSTERAAASALQVARPPGEGRLPVGWALAPIGIVLALMLLPLWLLAAERVRGRRAEASHRRHAAERAARRRDAG